MARLLYIAVLFNLSCAFGGSASVSVGPKFLADTTAWTLTLSVSPTAYLEPSGVPRERGAPVYRESAYAAGMTLRTFGTVSVGGAGFAAAPGVGLGFNPYMLVRPDGQPVFDSHMGFQMARTFGASNGLEVGPHVSMAFRAFDAGFGAGMLGGGLDCLIAAGGLGCGPIAQFKLMRTSRFSR